LHRKTRFELQQEPEYKYETDALWFKQSTRVKNVIQRFKNTTLPNPNKTYSDVWKRIGSWFHSVVTDIKKRRLGWAGHAWRKEDSFIHLELRDSSTGKHLWVAPG